MFVFSGQFCTRYNTSFIRNEPLQIRMQNNDAFRASIYIGINVGSVRSAPIDGLFLLPTRPEYVPPAFIREFCLLSMRFMAIPRVPPLVRAFEEFVNENALLDDVNLDEIDLEAFDLL